MSILKRFAGMAHSDARLKGRIDALTAETESLRVQWGEETEQWSE